MNERGKILRKLSRIVHVHSQLFFSVKPTVGCACVCSRSISRLVTKYSLSRLHATEVCQVRARDHVLTHVRCRFDTAPYCLRRHAPLLGEHTRDVLADTGATPEQLDALIAAGVVRHTHGKPVVEQHGRDPRLRTLMSA